jgi:Zn-dependent peptidase ImmA (M78 family)
MSVRVDVKPELLRWARERAGRDVAELGRRFPRLGDWEAGTAQPTLRQLEDFAKATHAPIGFFFLQEPPVETVPIPDLRTVGDRGVDRPSPDLLDTIYICQERQEWYREFARSEHEPALPFVGSLTLQTTVASAAARIAGDLDFGLDDRRRAGTWTEALRRFIVKADEGGILVMVNGVVGNNNGRKLDPHEFRGFALSDSHAPLVFLNGADSKAAQMFTLAHELAHVWLGATALSDAGPSAWPMEQTERWCNQVAAELLVPADALRREVRPGDPIAAETSRLARYFKVSTLVVLRRLRDIGVLTEDQFWAAYREETTRLAGVERAGGGDFYLTQGARVSKRFARALVVSTLEGRTLYTEAFRLLGFAKLATFRELGQSLGVA